MICLGQCCLRRTGATHFGGHELGCAAEGRGRLAEPHVLLAQSVVGDLDVPVEREEDVVELEIAGRASAGAGGREDSPVDDAVLVEVLERKQDLGRVELGTPRGELLALDVQHQVAARHVLHHKVDARLGLEARMQAEQEGVTLFGRGEEHTLLGLGAAARQQAGQKSTRTSRPRRSR